MLLAHVKKELLLLSRDRGGLLVLFVMPMMLVLVLSLIQDNLFRASGETATRALFVNQDKGPWGEELAQQLEATGALELVTKSADKKVDQSTARQLVFRGDFQFAIIVPENFSTRVGLAAERSVKAAFHEQQDMIVPGQLKIFFDPTLRGVYRTAVTNALARGVTGLEIARKSAALGRQLPIELKHSLEKQFGPDEVNSVQLELPQLSGDWARQTLIELHEESSYPAKYTTLPTSVQQNVPAWTLFGMFFIVIPLAGTLIRERQEGTMTRLMTMPVSNGSLLLGKILAYLLICLIQAVLMLMVGKFILPLLGTPVLEIGSAPLALFFVAVSAALAACGYGILVGVVVRSYEQASTFGAVSVVIAAALGGVMVPVYVMPRAMQDLSVISPLGWGLDAFLEIFIRDGDLVSVMPRIAALGGFFILCLFCALLVSRRWRRGV